METVICKIQSLVSCEKLNHLCSSFVVFLAKYTVGENLNKFKQLI